MQHGGTHRIIGIDPGTRVTGFALIEATSTSRFRAGVRELGAIRLPRDLSWLERIVALCNTVGDIVERCQPHTVVIEKAFFGINAASALKLGEARGAILAELTSAAEIPKVVEVSPTQAKKLITGNGHASKQQLALALTNLLNIDLRKTRNDATDALALAFCYHLALQPLRPVHGFNVRANRASAQLSSADRPKKGRAQLSCVPAVGRATPPQSDPNSEN